MSIIDDFFKKYNIREPRTAYIAGKVAGYMLGNSTAMAAAYAFLGPLVIIPVIATKISGFKVMYDAVKSGNYTIGRPYDDEVKLNGEPKSLPDAFMIGYTEGEKNSTLGMVTHSKIVKKSVEVSLKGLATGLKNGIDVTQKGIDKAQKGLDKSLDATRDFSSDAMRRLRDALSKNDPNGPSGGPK